MQNSAQLQEARREARKSLESAGEAIQASKRAIAETATSIQASAADKVESLVGEAKAKASTTKEAAELKLVQAQDFAKQKADVAVTTTREGIRKRPFAVVATSTAVGVAVGWLLARFSRKSASSTPVSGSATDDQTPS